MAFFGQELHRTLQREQWRGTRRTNDLLGVELLDLHFRRRLWPGPRHEKEEEEEEELHNS